MGNLLGWIIAFLIIILGAALEVADISSPLLATAGLMF